MRSIVRSPAALSRRFFSAAKAAVATVENTVMQPNSTIALPITTKLVIHDPQADAKIPVFRILDPSGKLLADSIDSDVNEQLAQKMYQHMVRIQCLDNVLYNAQRQGRISFYMQAHGEEAIHIGARTCSSAAFLPLSLPFVFSCHSPALSSSLFCTPCSRSRFCA